MKGRKPGLETLRKRMAGSYSGPPPECPDWLDENAKAEWARVVPELVKAGVLTPVDSMTLAAYCQMYSQWRKAEEQSRGEGLTFVDSKGNVKMHPCATHAVKLMGELRRIASEFGFSPAARTRVNAPPAPNEEESDLNDFLHPSERNV